MIAQLLQRDPEWPEVIRQGSVEAVTQWLQLAWHILWTVEGGWTHFEEWASTLTSARANANTLQFVGRQLLGDVALKRAICKDLVEEAERRDVQPKLASLWWSNTYTQKVRKIHDVGNEKDNMECPLKRASRFWDALANCMKGWKNECRRPHRAWCAGTQKFT